MCIRDRYQRRVHGVNLTDTLLGEAWYWTAWVVWLPLFARCVSRAPWARLRDSEQLNVWLGMVVLLTLVWSLKAGVKPGLGFHLLGATVFTLSFGPYLAFVGLSLVVAGITLNGAAGPFAYALNALLLAGASVGISQMRKDTLDTKRDTNWENQIKICKSQQE
eukprot:TRINITY_DN9125_c0_g1_i1.p1 TRINITY_DN9125_c0_g1~~TRINITY_DN9125_c0_g1_i1.p1  ORF type:complete len:163 (-),score=12.74 TRINITY_DN9125_c0_g1_i1:40-528(-)